MWFILNNMWFVLNNIEIWISVHSYLKKSSVVYFDHKKFLYFDTFIEIFHTLTPCEFICSFNAICYYTRNTVLGLNLMGKNKLCSMENILYNRCSQITLCLFIFHIIFMLWTYAHIWILSNRWSFFWPKSFVFLFCIFNCHFCL